MKLGWLLDFFWPHGGDALPPAAAALDPAALWRSVDGQRGRAYLTAPAQPGPQWTAVDLLQAIEGPDAGEPPRCHYTVETDIAPEHEDDFNAWYGLEHLPGLAQVPGTVRALRLRRRCGAPRYLACYDLLLPDTLLHPDWLAVRGTAWSSKVRSRFVAPQRTMFVRATAYRG